MMKNELKDYIESEQKKGKTVAMACGCFSVFHPGHLEYLKIAKIYCDILIVGINSDDYLKRVKKKKFFFTEAERKNMLSELRCVDEVFVFKEENFSESLKFYKPNIFVKGIDYINSINFEEKEICDTEKIKIMIAGERKRYDSSTIAEFYTYDYE